MLFRGILAVRLGGGEAKRTSAAIIGYHFTDSKQQVIRGARTRTASAPDRRTPAIASVVSRVQVARRLTRVASLSWQRWRSSGKGGNPRIIRQRAWGDARLPYSRDTPTIIAAFPPPHALIHTPSPPHRPRQCMPLQCGAKMAAEQVRGRRRKRVGPVKSVPWPRLPEYFVLS